MIFLPLNYFVSAYEHSLSNDIFYAKVDCNYCLYILTLSHVLINTDLIFHKLIYRIIGDVISDIQQ
jgi:hypothetical protein